MDSNSEGNAEYQETQFFDGLDGNGFVHLKILFFSIECFLTNLIESFSGQMGQDMSGGAEGDMFTGEYEQMSPLREQVFTSCLFSLFFI